MYNKVYIIDDDEISIFLTQTMLEVIGFAKEYNGFLCAKHALDNLQGALQNGHLEELPDIIFLDLNMPLISGWQILDTLDPFAEVLEKRCKIYVLSSSVDAIEQKVAESYRLVSAFLHKPLDDQAINRIKGNH